MAVRPVLLRKNVKRENSFVPTLLAKSLRCRGDGLSGEKEAYTVHWALFTWRQFLEGRIPFKVWTNLLEVLKKP